jgi:hypothetical protein
LGQYLSFGPILPPGNVILQVFHLEIMRKLQQLLFLGPRRREIGGQEGGGTDLLQAGGRRASQGVFQGEEVWDDGNLGRPKALGSWGGFRTRT